MRGTLPLRVYYVASFAVGGVFVPFFPRWLEARGMFGLRLGIISAAAPAMALFAPAAFGVVADALAIRVGLLQLACLGALASFATLAISVGLGARTRVAGRHDVWPSPALGVPGVSLRSARRRLLG
jgi:PPP family 3-phenylpropionic acid transporter